MTYYLVEEPAGTFKFSRSLPVGIVSADTIRIVTFDSPTIVPPEGKLTFQEYLEFLNNLPGGTKYKISSS
ncbi:unnamed protein product [Gemmata massiliana]|uniref:Uncharacterized protein n=1 Tax=Gemmata massiliana TaxID=1210884 RepID=A0A6P2CYU8_9BACT|nr:unnamed protein product [Gemmata massiliana]